MTFSPSNVPAAPAATLARRETPKFTGITIHHDPRGRFTIRYPSDWHVFEINSDVPVTEVVSDGALAAGGKKAATGARRPRRSRRGKPEPPRIAAREGIGFAPNAEDPATVFTAWAAPLHERVVAEDLDDLREGVEEALRLLDDCQVEVATENVFGNLIRFERVYTFGERVAGSQADDTGEAGDAGQTSRDAPAAVRKRKQWLLYVDRWLICVTWQGSSIEEYEYWFAMANQSFLTFEIPEALWFATDRELLAQLSHNQLSGPDDVPGGTGETGNTNETGDADGAVGQ